MSKKNNLFLLSFAFIFVSSAFGYDANQYLPDQLDDEKGEGIENSFSNDESAYLSGGTKDYLETLSTVDPKSYALPDSTDDVIENGEEPSDLKNHQAPMGTFENSKEYLSYSAGDHFNRYNRSGTRGVTFSYIMLDHNPSKRAYTQTFDSEKSRDYGALMVHFDRFFMRKSALELGFAFGSGVGVRSGQGTFASSGDRSQTTFRLWTIPVDAHLAVALPIFKFAKLYASAGPMAMVLLQNRDDFSDGEKGKNLNQIGYGYSARAAFKLSLANMFKSSAHKMFRSNNITNSFLNFEGRYDNASNFQDEGLTMSGVSIGAGLSFEYF